MIYLKADRPLTGPSRDAVADQVAYLASAGLDDPTIGLTLEVTPSQVRGLRREHRIPPGKPKATSVSGRPAPVKR